MADRIAQYFAAGTRLVWVIDPRERTALVYRSPAEACALSVGGVLDGDDVLPGFRCRLSELFD